MSKQEIINAIQIINTTIATMSVLDKHEEVDMLTNKIMQLIELL